MYFGNGWRIFVRLGRTMINKTRKHAP